MGVAMTELSRVTIDRILQGDLSAADAAFVLAHEIRLRTFREKLERFGGGRELRPLLVNGLVKNHPEATRDSLDRKVRGWLAGSYEPTRRQDILEICFILGLSVTDADAFVAMASGEGFHWRDPDEIVDIYALRHGMDYPAMQALKARLADAVLHENAALPPEEDSFTPMVRKEVEALETEEELGDFLHRAKHRLGKLHNNAYQQFMAFMSLLESPEIMDLMEPDAHYTTRQIVETYLDKKLPALRKGAALTAMQRDVRANWPDETSISRMKNREIDVSRKVLILLFLVTDGGEREDDDELDEETPEEAFRSSYCRLDNMLEQCGYRTLDPRSAFDWAALYCLRVDDVLMADRQMQDFLNALFCDGN